MIFIHFHFHFEFYYYQSLNAAHYLNTKKAKMRSLFSGKCCYVTLHYGSVPFRSVTFSSALRTLQLIALPRAALLPKP